MREMGLGDRMKFYEVQTSRGEFLMPLVPWIVRVDGKAFHTFTRGCLKPYDENIAAAMRCVTAVILHETHANLAYVQSDEISLLYYTEEIGTMLYFDGKIQKLNSVIASIATSAWADQLINYAPPGIKALGLPNFDARAFAVPTKTEACNYFIWREQDAVRNSIQGLGQAYFSHNKLHGKNCDEVQEMLFQEHKINWNDLPAEQKRGAYLRRLGSDIVTMNWPRLTQITNREAVIFDNAQPAEAVYVLPDGPDDPDPQEAS